MKKGMAVALAAVLWFGWGEGVLAAGPQLLIINKQNNTLAYYEDGELVQTYRVATGADRSFTPEGRFQVIKKAKNVPYYKYNIPGGDPSNPLGDRWIGINATADGMTYGIHGTNDESSIGKYVSNGCVRMHNAEVRGLYEQVRLHTPVLIARSGQDFDQLASSTGYQLMLHRVQQVNLQLTALENVALYSKPHTYYHTTGRVAPQPLQAFEKRDGWYHIRTWYGDAWITKEGVLEGAVHTVNKQVQVTSNTNLYESPNSPEAVVGVVAPQTVTAFQEWNGWLRINTWLGNLWMKP